MPFPPLWLTRPMMRRTQPPTIMLLMGIWISFTKKPMNPMIANPIAVAMAIFWNSFLSGLVHLLTSWIESFTNCQPGSRNCITWSMFVGWRFESRGETEPKSHTLSPARAGWHFKLLPIKIERKVSNHLPTPQSSFSGLSTFLADHEAARPHLAILL